VRNRPAEPKSGRPSDLTKPTDPTNDVAESEP